MAQSPFATAVKTRDGTRTVFGQFTMRKVDSPWRDARLRQAVNSAINREDLIRYATKGNGMVIPELLPPGAFGYNPKLTLYPFDPAKARQLLRGAGYPNGLPGTLLASQELMEFVPYVTTVVTLAETEVAKTHWSVPERKAVVSK